MIKRIILIVSLLFIGILLLNKQCSVKPTVPGKIIKIKGKKYQVIKTIVDTQYVNKTKVVYKNGDTIYKEIPVYVNIPTDVDTNKILKEYYSKVPYKDTLILDNNLGTITVNDTIFKNRILNRVWKADIKEKIVNKTDIVAELPKIRLSIGGVGGVVNGLPYIGPSILVNTKKDMVYGVSVGVGYDNLINYQMSIHKTLKFRK